MMRYYEIAGRSTALSSQLVTCGDVWHRWLSKGGGDGRRGGRACTCYVTAKMFAEGRRGTAGHTHAVPTRTHPDRPLKGGPRRPGGRWRGSGTVPRPPKLSFHAYRDRRAIEASRAAGSRRMSKRAPAGMSKAPESGGTCGPASCGRGGLNGLKWKPHTGPRPLAAHPPASGAESAIADSAA